LDLLLSQEATSWDDTFWSRSVTGFKAKMSENKNRKAEQVLSGEGLVSVGGEEDGKRVQEGEYGANTVNTCMHMEE
jgi:hypothetical protein